MKKTLNRWNAWAAGPASALLLLPALHLPRALAQPSAAADTLPPVTVHATGLGLRADEMAAPVSVLDGTWWQMRQASTLGESLEGELGIQSSHFGAGASRPIIRGLDGPRMGVLSNGRELHDASMFSPDHRVVTEPLLSEGVEILRGPSALVHGGAVGGVVNVLDRKIPVQRPDKPVQGEAAVQWSSADRGRNAAMGLTTGQGPWVIRVEAAGRDAQDYRAGQGAGQVVGSATDTASGSVGLSYVTDRGHLGASYTRYQAQYGLPGHAHAHCHLHGSLHIHCHSHAHGDGEAPPQVDMHSHRWDVQGLLRQPLPGIASVDFSASHTRYSHDEQEEGIVATAFRNRAHELRLNVQHEAINGWRGRVGVSQSRCNFGAQGEEAYVPPSTTLKQGVYLLEELRVQDWSLQAAVRHDRQTVRAAASGKVRTHHGNSASLGAVWHWQPSLQATASYSHAARLPSAEELLADGMHMATNA
ncbi:MAG: TonB-dependent receptor domain-containing protein, partial [Comamonas sp.]